MFDATSLPRPLTILARFRHPLLWLWLGLLLARNGPALGNDWSAFVYGSKLLFGGHSEGLGFTEPGGLHVYANYPNLHMGPLGLLAAAGIRLVFPHDRFAAMLAMAALGPLVVMVVERAAVRARGLREAAEEPLLALVILISGAAFLRAWVSSSWVYVHLEEDLIVVGAAVAVWCVVTRRPVAAAVAIGLAIATKSSAVLLLPLLACFPRREALRASAVAVGIACAAWLPFYLADTGTFDTSAHGSVGTFPASALRFLGINAAVTPDWVRPTQVALGLTLAFLAVWRGRWEGAILVAVAARLALDPSTSTYYTAGLVFAALVWDLAGRRPIPIWAPLIAATYELVPKLGAGPHAEGAARLAVDVAAILAVLVLPRALVRAAPAPAPRSGVTESPSDRGVTVATRGRGGN